MKKVINYNNEAIEKKMRLQNWSSVQEETDEVVDFYNEKQRK